MLHDLSHDTPTGGDPDAPGPSEQLAREQAIKQIERRHHFKIRAAVFAVGMILLAFIWATTEYHNAGGWPTQGLNQSSGIPNAWNYRIIYPLIAWLLLTAADAWFVLRAQADLRTRDQARDRARGRPALTATAQVRPMQSRTEEEVLR